MPLASPLAADLARYGPAGTAAPATLDVARAYCRHLARTHYENFVVASCLLPGELRQHMANVYAYCRWADDLADEASSPAASLALLDWWEAQLDDCYRGTARHPVFVALGETIRQFDIPREPLADLLVAFRQDQHVTRYETLDELLEYCRYSANPVGRLVLHLGRCHDEVRGHWADAICTGLQLANFCQDVARDWDRGRCYLPTQACQAHGCDQTPFAGRTATPAFRAVLAWQVDVAESWLRAGQPLIRQMPRVLAVDVWLFVQGGLAILRAIRRCDYDVWTRRPTVPRWRQLGLLTRALWWRLLAPVTWVAR